jgi:hypothetical protein
MGRVGLGVGARFEGFVSFAGSLLCCVFREELTTLRKPNQPSRDQQGMDLSACTATWDANGSQVCSHSHRHYLKDAVGEGDGSCV